MSVEDDRYPLRCRPAEWEGIEDGGWELALFGETRCRKVKATEVGLTGQLKCIAEALDEEMQSGAIGAAWGPYGDEMVTLRPGAEEAFARFLDTWVDVLAHINEGDDS